VDMRITLFNQSYPLHNSVKKVVNIFNCPLL
jgi:hypothetical protein